MLYIFFFKFTVMATMKEPRVNIPSSPELYKELELWYQQQPLASIYLLRWSR